MIKIVNNYFKDEVIFTIDQDIINMFNGDRDLIVDSCIFYPNISKSLHHVKTLYEIALENAGSKNIIIKCRYIHMSNFSSYIKAIVNLVK